MLLSLRKAGERHSEIKNHITNIIKPGLSLLDLCQTIERLCITPAFPATISINNIAAHDSPTNNDKRIIPENSLIKIDYGIIEDGYIIDAAFSIAFDDTFLPLINCAEEAVWSTIKQAGPDCLLNSLSENIQEIIESHEIEINGKTYNIKSSKTLCGHNMKKNILHGKKKLPGYPTNYNINQRMEANEQWAIEVFPTTGNGFHVEDLTLECSCFSIVDICDALTYKLSKDYGQLPFTTRWLDDDIISTYTNYGYDSLKNNKGIKSYFPFVDIPGSYSSQLEHTVFIHDNGFIEVFS